MMDKNSKIPTNNLNSFEKLEAWKAAHTLVLAIYQHTKSFPSHEKYGLTSQIQRAAVSIAANLAEGNQRKSPKEFSQFCYTAKASLAEVKYFLILARDLHYFSSNAYQELDQQASQVLKLINGLIKYIHTLEKKITLKTKNPKSKIQNHLVGVITLLSFITTLFMLLPSSAQSATGVPQSITFQGKVVNADGTNVTDGAYDFEFKIYNGASSGASTLFTETWSSTALLSSQMSSAPGNGGTSSVYSTATNESTLRVGQVLWNTTKKEPVIITAVDTGTNTITHSATRQAWSTSDTITNRIYVKDGIFKVALNTLNANWGTVDFSDDQLFLGINYQSDGEMKPRVQFTSSAYSFYSEDSHALGGVAATGYLRSNTSDNFTSGTLTFDASTKLNLAASSTLDIDGDLEIADTTITLNAGAAQTILAAGGSLQFGANNDSTNLFTLSSNATDLTLGTTDGANLTIDTAGTLTIADATFFSNRLNVSHGNNQGLNLPTNAGSPSGVTGTAEGDIVWDSTGNALYVYDGSGFTQVGGGGYTGWTITDGTTPQTISSGDTLTVADSATINAVTSATDTLTYSVVDDSLNFAQFADSMSLDAATTIALGANAFTFNLDSTGDFVIADNGTPFATFTDSGTFQLDNLQLDGNTISSFTSGGLTLSPLAGQNLNVSLSTTGDFIVNTDDLVVDTSTGYVGIGTATPSEKLALVGGNFLHTASGDPTLKGTYNTSGNAMGVYVSGKYAYVADNAAGLQVIDVSNPASPSLVGTYNTSGYAVGVYVSGKYAYVADHTDGLQVIDVSNPASPSLVGTYNTSGEAWGVYVSGKYAYVADGTAGLHVIDISNPASPSLVGTYNTSGNALGVYVSGKYAYVADNAAGLQVIDVSNPASPSLVGTYDTSGYARGVYVSGKYAYVADNAAGLQVIDVSNPASPSLVGTYDTSGYAYGVYVSGKYAYVADHTDGLQVIDVSNPASPSLVGTYDTSGNAVGVYVSGKYAYVGDDATGLQIIDINGMETPALYAGNIQTNDLTITENGDIGNNLYVRNGLNVGAGGIMSDGNLTFGGRLTSPTHGNNQGLNLPTNAGTPSGVTGTAEGDIVWDSTGNALYVYDGTGFTQVGAGYTAGNDLDLSGNQFNIESQLDFVTTISRAASNLALQTTTSGDITLTTGASTGLVNVLTGNLKVGNGTPTTTLNGNDAYVTGTFEVDSTTSLDGAVTLGSTLTLPNSSVLTGDTSYLRSSRGLAFGANETYYINSSGTGNLNALTLAGTLTANNGVDLSGTRLDLDADNDTSIIASTDDTIDIEIAGANDFQFTANAFTALTSSDIVTSNLGVNFTDSDTNPSCSSGDYKIYADTSDGKLKKCQNGTVTDIDTNSTSDVIFKAKNADQGVSNQTLTDETALQFPIGANEEWNVIWTLMVTNGGSSSPNWKSAVVAPTGSSCLAVLSGTEPNGQNWPQTSTTNCTTPTELVNDSTGSDGGIPFEVLMTANITASSTPGTVKMQFARNNTAGTSVTVKAGSIMQAYKVTGADLAEVYYSQDASIRPGHVVSLDGINTAGVKKSTEAYSTQTLGIVSTKPGLVLSDTRGNNQGSPVLVALAGRVPMKVSPNSQAISPGDYVASSLEPGLGMKAERAGFVIGKALESWSPDSDKDYVMVFIYNTWHDPQTILTQNGDLNLPGDATINGSLTVGGENIISRLSMLDSRLSTTEQLISSLTTDYQLLSNDILSHTTTLNNLTSQYAGLATSVSSLESVVSSQGDEISNIEHRISNIEQNAIGIGVPAPASGSGKLVDTLSGAYLSASGVWTNVSDVTKKENFTDIDKDKILDGILELGITRWNYKSDSDHITHIGPTAQQFYSVFGVGDNNKTISTLDPASIALVGVQALAERQALLDSRLSNIEGQQTNVEHRTSNIESDVAYLLDLNQQGEVNMKKLAQEMEQLRLAQAQNQTTALPTSKGELEAETNIDHRSSIIEYRESRVDTDLLTTLTQRLDQLEGLVLGMTTLPEPYVASASSTYTSEMKDLYTSEVLDPQVEASVSAELTNLEEANQIVNIISPITDLDLNSFIATSSSDTASNSAYLNTYLVHQQNPSDFSIIESLSVSTDLYVGSLAINGRANSISTIGEPLRLQTNQLAGNIEAFNQKIILTSTGDIQIIGTLTAQKVKTTEIEADKAVARETILGKINIATQSADLSSITTSTVSASTNSLDDASIIDHRSSNFESSIGTATLPARRSEITILNSTITQYSKVFITPLSLTDSPLSVTEIIQGIGFTVSTKTPSLTPTEFNWWIIN